MIAIGQHDANGKFCGQVSKIFNDSEYLAKEYGRFGNFSDNEFVANNQEMTEMGEDAFKANMEKEVANVMSFVSGA